MDDKIVRKLVFPDYMCKIKENGDVSLCDHHAEHMIYVYKSQFVRILKLYKEVFKIEELLNDLEK